MTTIQENEKLDTTVGIHEPEATDSSKGTDLPIDALVPNEPIGSTFMEIPLNTLRRFHDHPFADYKGDELQKMVDSIRSKGLIHPIAVRSHPTEDSG